MNEDKQLNRVADILKILGHPARMRIVILLAQQGEASVSAIKTQLAMEQSLLSHNLIKMKDKGILNSQRKGKKIYYSLSDLTLINTVAQLLD